MTRPAEPSAELASAVSSAGGWFARLYRGATALVKTLYRNLRWGIHGGLVFGSVYAAWVVILYLLGAERVWKTEYKGYNLRLVPLLALYLLGRAVTGAVVGLLRPFVTSRVGAAFVGLVAAIPAFAGVRLVLFGFAPIQRMDLVVLPIAIVAMGPLAGLILHEIFFDKKESPPARRHRHRHR